MGCSYCPSPREIQYHNIDYSNPDVIQGLLRFYYEFKAQSEWDMNAELVCVYCDLEFAINNIELTDKQKRVMRLYMVGNTEDEIGKIMKCSHQNVHKLLMKVCAKITKFLMEGER